jgi:phytoene dehydrogenase-like protein
MKQVVVLGGGHNGLVAASYLAKSGYKVTLLEKNADLGGLAKTVHFGEFETTGFLADASSFRPRVLKKLGLNLDQLKLEGKAEIVCPHPKNASVTRLSFDRVHSSNKTDETSFLAYRAFFNRIRPFMRSVFDNHPPQVYALNFHGLWDLMKKAVVLRMLGKSDMMELLRIGPMCTADWLSEWFEDDHLRAVIAAPSLYGQFQGPWSPGSNGNLILHQSFSESSIDTSRLLAELEQTARRLGVVIRTNTEVESILCDSGAVEGVRLADGEVLTCTKILSTLPPKHLFLNLLSTPGFVLEKSAQKIRDRGTSALVCMALTRPLTLKYHDQEGSFSHLRLVGGMDDLERSFDPVKYGEASDNPSLDVRISYQGTTQVLSILCNFVAPDFDDSEWVYSACLKKLQSYCGDLEVSDYKVILPKDLKSDFGSSSVYHLEHAADQLLTRPSLDTQSYATPIKGLYLGGSGSHPGGGLTGAPGSLAAEALIHA